MQRKTRKKKREENFNKLRTLVTIVRDKLLILDGIYAVYSVKTGEPYLFAKTSTEDEDNYLTSPPMIHLVTKANKKHLKERNVDDENYDFVISTMGKINKVF